MLTLEDARAYAREEVARMGEDFVYKQANSVTNCYYVPTTDPRLRGFDPDRHGIIRHPAQGAQTTGCLVGGIITRAGLMTDAIARSVLGVASLVDGSLALLPVQDSDTRTYLIRLQQYQDAGMSWGKAYQEAEDWLSTTKGEQP
jgi:hypothetical protein